MDSFYVISLLVFVVGSFALVGLFLWQLLSGKLRSRDAVGRGFDPIFPTDRIRPDGPSPSAGAHQAEQTK